MFKKEAVHNGCCHEFRRGRIRDGHASLICKGDFVGRRKTVETLARDERVPMHFQKNAWVDSEVAIALAKDFVQRVRSNHGDFWVSFHSDNLRVHCNAEVKCVCWEGKVSCVVCLLDPLNPRRL